MTELEILFKVYKEEEIKDLYTKSETPDFIISNPINKTKFGVEITTLYNNQASAIMRDNSFNDNFIDRNKPDFKAKKKKKPKYLERLNVAKVEGGENYVHKGHVIWHITNPNDFFDFFKGVIEKKNGSYETLNNLEFVNLIAKDEDNFAKANKLGPGEVYGLLRKHDLFETIISSNFQEIYLISEFHTGIFNIPLKWYIFRNEYELFRKFWLEKVSLIKERKGDIDLMLKNFCVCLIHLGFNGVYLFSGNEGHKYLVFGNSYWQINLEKKTIDEKPFTGKGLEKKTEMKTILINHEKYTPLFGQYMNFRNTIVPQINENQFIKIK